MIVKKALLTRGLEQKNFLFDLSKKLRNKKIRLLGAIVDF